MNKYITEFIGTFFLVLTVALTGNPIAIGAVLMVMIYMGGNISGAHYNPAVTLAVIIRGKIGIKDAVIYWVFQFAGAFIAALICLWITGKSFAASPAPGVDFLKAVACEFIFTFAFVSV